MIVSQILHMCGGGGMEGGSYCLLENTTLKKINLKVQLFPKKLLQIYFRKRVVELGVFFLFKIIFIEPIWFGISLDLIYFVCHFFIYLFFKQFFFFQNKLTIFDHIKLKYSEIIKILNSTKK